MASQGPTLDVPIIADPVDQPVVLPHLADAPAVESIPAALAASTPRPVVKRAAPTPKPPVAPAPHVAMAAPAPEIPVAVPMPAAVETAPVVTIPERTPAAAPAPALTQKDKIMDTITNVTEKTQEQAQALFADANERAKSAMEKGTKLLADINEFSKGNIEAVVESSKIAAKGAEDVARYTTDFAKGAVEKANANARQFAAVKSPTEFMKLQSEIAKDAVDSMMAETAKFTEHYLKLLGEIAQPMSNRVAVAAEKMKIAA